MKDDAINSWNDRVLNWSKWPVMWKYHSRLAYVAAAVTLANASPAATAVKAEAPPYGLSTRSPPTPYLRMPHLAGGEIPPLLSQTGAFSAARDFVPGHRLIPYDIVVAFWSDGAAKSRWVAATRRTSTL